MTTLIIICIAVFAAAILGLILLPDKQPQDPRGPVAGTAAEQAHRAAGSTDVLTPLMALCPAPVREPVRESARTVCIRAAWAAIDARWTETGRRKVAEYSAELDRRAAEQDTAVIGRVA